LYQFKSPYVCGETHTFKYLESPRAMMPIDLPGIFTNPPKPAPVIPDNSPKELIPEPGG